MKKYFSVILLVLAIDVYADNSYWITYKSGIANLQYNNTYDYVVDGFKLPNQWEIAAAVDIDKRYAINLVNISYTNGGNLTLSESVDGYLASFLVKERSRLHKDFKPFIILGAAVGNYQQIDRAVLDRNGYNREDLADAEYNRFYVVVGMHQEYMVNERLGLGIEALMYYSGKGNSVESLNLTLAYKVL